eukprot:scaffold70260_cov78-Phaeocystis_antarctica.AAC.2
MWPVSHLLPPGRAFGCQSTIEQHITGSYCAPAEHVDVVAFGGGNLFKVRGDETRRSVRGAQERGR